MLKVNAEKDKFMVTIRIRKQFADLSMNYNMFKRRIVT